VFNDKRIWDPETGYNVKVAADGKRKTTYGFKMHANTNEDGFVKKMTYTPSNVYDSQEFVKLLNINKSQEQYEGKLKPF
jgi:IS5 family transposase